MLQVIISPAKQMQVARDGFAPRGIPPLSEKTAHVMDALRTIEREQGSEGLQALWGVNDKLLAENMDRLHSHRDIVDANLLGDAELSRLVSPAIFSYVGIQFRSMAPDVLDAAALEWLQGHLWCFPRSMAAFDRSMRFSRIAWRWVPNCPWMGRRISMRFGAIRSRGPCAPGRTRIRAMWSKL